MKDATKLMQFAATGQEILGKTFSIDSFVVGGKFNETKFKKAIIKDQAPHIVVDSLKGAALDSMYDCLVKSAKKKVVDWKEDMTKIGQLPKKANDEGEKLSAIETAKQNRLAKINK